MTDKSPHGQSIFETIASDQKHFNDYAYTPWKEALDELERRQKDPELQEKVRKLLPHGLPAGMDGKKNIVLFRHIATPNYEISRFLLAADALADEVNPLVLEYTKDKFTNRNDAKFALAKLGFHKGRSKNKELILENKVIVDINDSNFKPIDSINTHWGQNFVDFHHELFNTTYPSFSHLPVDISDWLHKHGEAAKDYYKAFLSLFVRDGILFENFLVHGKEHEFTKDIVLRAMLEIEQETGKKVLIVPLEPTSMDDDRFWVTYPHPLKEVVDEKMKG